MTASSPLPVGAAVLDPAAATLTGPGGPARLTPQPLRLLLCMAGLAGRVVPYPEAVAALDNRYGRVEAPTVLAHLAYVRRALRESGSGAVAETVAGYGVRLRVPAPDEPAPHARARPRVDALRSRSAALAAMLANPDLCERVRRMRAEERRPYDFIAGREDLPPAHARMLGAALGLPAGRLDRGARA